MATLGTFVAGQILTAAELNAIGTWTTFTPSWTNFTAGNATQSFRYTEINKLMIVTGTLTLGSTSVMGSSPRFTIPNSRTAIGENFGVARINDSGTGNFLGVTTATGTVIVVSVEVSSGTYGSYADVTATVPMTWTTNDGIFLINVFPIS